ncbi:hypothetical protein P3W85_29820 [Cupriavidus basilensis]|uniref:Uncharacterized protein n=1 Tax=Cupriavidus basilensis TaxID=68895 RepID=A0ABT6AWW5_9BURK|nr:hypothetical protein [Cupriavidus basilensis]MDF3837121.1 hypothetical protein [Cupriavidus basilensis]
MENGFDTIELKAELIATRELAAFALALVHNLDRTPPEALEDIKEALIATHRSIAEETFRDSQAPAGLAEFEAAYERSLNSGITLAKAFLDKLNRIRGSEQN